MTTAADDRASEGAFEALLAGRPAPEGAAGLAAFTGAVRGAATQPGRPSAALAELLSTGLLTDQSSPSARTAPAAAGTPVGPRSRTRRRLTVIVPALIAKLLSAGAVAQAAAGAGVAVVVVAGAGTVGVLPGETQVAFSEFTGVGETVEQPTAEVPTGTEPVNPDGTPATPTDVPLLDDESDATDEDAEDTVELTDEQKAKAWVDEAEMITSQAHFKEWLARGKAQGWVSGSVVSTAVHARNEARKKARDGGEESEETPEVEPVQPEPEQDSDEEAGDDSEDSGTSKAGGKAKGDGGGKAKGSKGKSGGKGKNRG
jgi:hypothetical protein